jgi:hypothetical protein
MNLPQKNTKITNLMNYEYIEWSFLFNIHAKVFLYIYDRKIWIVKHVIIPIYYWPLILSLVMHKVILIYLFILCTQSCNNEKMTICMYNVL